MTHWRSLATDDRAASAAEYAIILGIIGASLALSIIAFSQNVACSIDDSAVMISGGDPQAGHSYGHSHPPGKAKGHHLSC